MSQKLGNWWRKIKKFDSILMLLNPFADFIGVVNLIAIQKILVNHTKL